MAVAQLNGTIAALEGPNFSGRTDRLHELARSKEIGDHDITSGADGAPNVFVGPDIHNYLSGVMPTTEGELHLHGRTSSDRRDLVDGLLDIVDARAFLHRNPLTLSGGQQVIVALATALLTARDLVAIDCCLEQLNPATRTATLAILKRAAARGVRPILADNRLREFREDVSVLPGHRPASTREAPPPVTSLTDYRIDRAVDMCLSHIAFAYRGGAPVLRDLSYRFSPGRVCFLTGGNGAGKTTLCKLLCGLLRPSRGTMTDAAGIALDPWKAPGKLAAYHFQNPDLQLFFTTVGSEIDDTTGGMAASFGLKGFLDIHPHDLPFALRKRVALAATLARARPWLIVDEPILGQDDATAEVLSATLRQLADAGAGVIVVAHSEWFRSLDPAAVTLRLEDGELQEIPSRD